MHDRARRVQSRDRRLDGVLLILPLLLGWALRTHGLGSVPFWYDDIIILEPARLPLGALLENIRHFWGVNPLEYILTSVALAVLGEHALTLRVPEACLSLIGLALSGRIARQQFGRRASLASLWILAAAVWPVRYAQELRSYSWFALSFWLIWQAVGRALARGSRRAWGLLALAGVSGSYVNYLAVLGLLRLPLAWMSVRRPSPRQVLYGVGAVALVVVAQLPWLAYTDPLDIYGDAVLQRESAGLVQVLSHALAGLGWIGSMYQTETGVLRVMLSVVPWVYLGLLGARRAARGTPEQRLLLFALLGGIAMLSVGGMVTRYSFFSGRNFLPLNLLWGMLAGFGLSRMAADAGARGQWLFWGGITIVTFAAIPQLAEFYRWEKTSAPAIARALPPDAGQLVVFGTQPAQYIAAAEIRYYYEKTHPTGALQLIEAATPPAAPGEFRWMAGPTEALAVGKNGPITPPGWRVVVPPRPVLGHIALFAHP